jgi:hypothetical protein
MRQVRVREIVHVALQDCLGQPFCLRDAEAACQVLRADLVQGAGALEGQVKSLFTGMVGAEGEGIDDAE